MWTGDCDTSGKTLFHFSMFLKTIRSSFQLILTGGTNTSFETPEVNEGFETEPDNTIINTKEKLQVQTTDDVVLVLQK